MTIRDDDRAEAQRLKLATKDDQRAVIDLHRSVAGNPKLSEAERSEARRKAAALEKLLNLKKPK